MLARQFLLERSRLPLTQTLERIGGLQTQYAPSGYVGLWSRMRNFRRGALTRALEERQVIQASLLRNTIHMVSAADFPLLLGAVSDGRRDWWLGVQRKQENPHRVEEAAALLRRELAAGPRRASEPKAALLAQSFPALLLLWGLLTGAIVPVPPYGPPGHL